MDRRHFLAFVAAPVTLANELAPASKPPSNISSPGQDDGFYMNFLPLEGHVTVDDSTGPSRDNGALACIQGVWKSALKHHSTEEAVKNLLNAATTSGVASAQGIKQFTLVGHGQSGIFVTGDGTRPSHKENFVSTWNIDIWEPKLMQLAGTPLDILTLLGCDAGAGDDGAELVHLVARVTGKSVRARTGLVACSTKGIVNYENGSTWQVAEPRIRPRPIPLPRAPFVQQNPKYLTVPKVDPLFDNQVKASVSINYGDEHSLDPNAARLLLKWIDFGHPLEAAKLLALPTARFIFDGRVFYLYNDRVLQDDETLVMYYTNPAISIALRTLLSGEQNWNFAAVS